MEKLKPVRRAWIERRVIPPHWEYECPQCGEWYADTGGFITEDGGSFQCSWCDKCVRVDAAPGEELHKA